MKTEIEAKSLKINKDLMRKRLKNIGAKLVFPEKLFERITFDNDELRKRNSWIRLRNEGDRITLAFKSVADEKSIHGMKEIEFEVSDYDSAINFITQLGFSVKNIQQNYREEWRKDNVTFDLDTWPDIDPYIEIEAPTEKDVINAFKLLGLNYSQAMFGSSDIVYRRIYGIDILKRKRLLFS